MNPFLNDPQVWPALSMANSIANFLNDPQVWPALSIPILLAIIWKILVAKKITINIFGTNMNIFDDDDD